MQFQQTKMENKTFIEKHTHASWEIGKHWRFLSKKKKTLTFKLLKKKSSDKYMMPNYQYTNKIIILSIIQAVNNQQ